MKKQLIIFLILLANFQFGIAQNVKEFDATYQNAIQQFKNQNFDKASILFNTLINDNSKNKYALDAEYFVALCLFKQKDWNGANQKFTQLLNKNPDWIRNDDIYYVLGEIAFLTNKSFEAMRILSSCSSEEISSDVFKMKKHYLGKIESIYELKVMHQKYPDDEALAIILASKLASKKVLWDDEVMLLEYLKQTFVFDEQLQNRIGDLENRGVKEKYNVAVMFPFEYQKLKSYNVLNNNQFVLDLFNGIKLAIEEINQNNEKINLVVYDTKNDTNELKKILKLEETKSLDLIFGPIYKEKNELTSAFCNQYKILKINPLSSVPLASDSNFGFYFEPSIEVMGQNSAKFCYDSITKKDVFIAGYNDYKDSIYISSFIKTFSQLGGKNVKVKYFGKFDQILTNMQEIGIDSSNTKLIIAYNSQSKLVSNLCSFYNIGRLEIPLFTTYEFTKSNQFLAESFKYTSLYCLNSNYSYKEQTDTFKLNYLEKYGFPASKHAINGYEMAMFFGKELIENGKYFHSKIKTIAENKKGTLFPYFNYYNSNSNTFIPIQKMEKYVLIPQNINTTFNNEPTK